MLHQENLSVNASGHLAISGGDAVALAEKYGTPLYVMDESVVRSRMTTYADAMKGSFPVGRRT